MEPTQKVEVTLPPDLAKRFTSATNDAERDAVLRDFAVQRGAETQEQKDAAIMSADQFRVLLEKMGTLSATSAKAAIEAVANDTERKLNLDSGEARKIAESSFHKTEQELINRQKDWEISAKVFRGMYLARQGKQSAYQNAIEEEGEYMKKTYGRVTRAMTLGTDSTGGYIAPQLFSDRLYENIARQSLVRRFATIIPMNSNEVINFPTMTSTVSAAQVSEGSAGTNSQPVFSQKQLTTKKIMTKTRPVSVEMIEKAHPAIFPLLLQFATIEIMKQEDALVFAASGNGIRASSTNLVTMGSAATGYSSIEFDDMSSMIGALDPQYTPDVDVQGSGIVSGIAQFWLPHSLKNELVIKKEGTGAYMEEARELRNQSKIFGYDARRTLSLPANSGLSALDKPAVFGDLSYVWCGIEPGFRVMILDQATIDDNGSPVNLGETAQAAVRVLEFFDSVVVDNSAFSIASLGA